jgi:ribose transport system substrate-binding protein
MSRPIRLIQASAAVLSLALAAAACGSSGGSSASSSSGSGSSSGGSSGGTSTGSAAASNRPSWCGSKKITVALADGFGDNNWRKITRAEAANEAAKCSSVTKYLYTDGQGNTQKSISDIQGLVSQGVNALVVFPDSGPAVLPAIRSAFKAGVAVVPYRVSPGGTAGQDYDTFIKTDFAAAGVLWAKWMVKALHGKGNIANLGGPPANSQSLAEYQGMQTVFKNYPGIHFVGQTPYNVTNWDPAQTQKVITSLLAKYPKIDGITTDFGAALASSFGAFKSAGRKIPAIATEDSNQLACDYKTMHSTDPQFKLFTVDSQTWMVRTAIDYAIAKASGGTLPSTNVPQKVFEDSLTGQPHAPECDTALPPDALLSSHLSTAELAKALAG